MARLITLGGLSIEKHGDGAAAGHVRSRLAILAVLAVAGARGIRREKLAAMFWPESNEERSRNALRQALFVLRRELGAGDLTIGAAELRLNTDALPSDVSEFEGALTAGDHARAVALYRGPFLDGVFVRDADGFERWAEEERRRLAARYADALEVLAVAAGRSGDAALAVRLWKRLAEHDPYSGRIARACVEALAFAGDREAAILHAESYVDRVRADLDADPDPSVRALANALRTATASATRGPSERSAAAPTRVAPRRRVMTVAVAMAASIVAVAGMWFSRASSAEVESGVVRFALSFSPDAPFANGVGAPFALAPDGNTVAYRGVSGTRLRIFVRALNSLDAVPLDGTDGGDQPHFSPDGNWIVFVVGDRLLKVPVHGGEVVALATLPEVRGLSWGSSGTIIVSSRDALFAVPAAGGPPERVTSPDPLRAAIGERWPLALGQGDVVLYTLIPDAHRGTSGGLRRARIAIARRGRAQDAVLLLDGMYALQVVKETLFFANTDGDIFAIPFDAQRDTVFGAPVRVARAVSVGPLGGVKASLSLSGSLAYLSEPSAGLVMVDTAAQSRTVIRTPAQYAQPRLSPDATRIAVVIGAWPLRDVSIYDIKTGAFTRLTNEGGCDAPEWTPEGTRVVFHCERAGRSALWRRPADASAAAERLTDSTQDAREGVVTPDGRALIYRTLHAQTGDDLWMLSLRGTRSSATILATRNSERLPRVSPDGQLMAYESDASGRVEVYVKPLHADGASVRVSEDGGRQPLWARSGRRVIYGSSGQVVAVDLTREVSPRVGARSVLLERGFVLLSALHPNYDIMPDGVHFLFPAPREADRVVVVRGWMSELK